MLQSQRNNATMSILKKLRNQGPKPSMMPAPFEDNNALEGEADVDENDADNSDIGGPDKDDTLNDMAMETPELKKKRKPRVE